MQVEGFASPREKLWFDTHAADALVSSFRDAGSERKWRLVAIACCHRISHLVQTKRMKDLLKTSEVFADGQADRNLLEDALLNAVNAVSATTAFLPEVRAISGAAQAKFSVRGVARFCRKAAFIARKADKRRASPNDDQDPEMTAQSELIRDIFGNPFRPAVIDPAWLIWNDGIVVKLAKTIYDERRWDLMPILGDALQDAMCDDAAIIEHCRGPGPHVRGCWVVDLILGKE
jgi:hypothetical protein